METITELEPAIVAIETAIKNGLKLVASGRDIDIVPPIGNRDSPSTQISVKQLAQNQDTVRPIVLDLKWLRETLAKAQQRLSKNNREFIPEFELLIRLMHLHGIFHPDDECITGDQGCPEDAVVACTACGKEKHGIQETLL